MTIFFQIIGWYCVISGILLGIALWSISDKDAKTGWRMRKTIAWLVHVAFLYTGVMILMH